MVNFWATVNSIVGIVKFKLCSAGFLSDPSVSSMATSKTHEILEDENDRLMDEMARKIDTLKTVSAIISKI